MEFSHVATWNRSLNKTNLTEKQEGVPVVGPPLSAQLCRWPLGRAVPGAVLRPRDLMQVLEIQGKTERSQTTPLTVLVVIMATQGDRGETHLWVRQVY